MVVILSPVLNDGPCLWHGREFFAVQTLVSQPSVEALDVAILPWTAWLNEARTDIDCGEKLADTPRGELGAVVAANELGNASDREQIGERLNEVIPSKFAPDLARDCGHHGVSDGSVSVHLIGNPMSASVKRGWIRQPCSKISACTRRTVESR